MAEAGKIVENLEVKVNKLIALHKSGTVENNKLAAENDKLNQLVNQQKSEIVQLNEKVKMVKLAKTIEGSGEDTSKLKLKINEVVREVDKCIAMLNK
ncbi:MAG: hypothetical protein JKY42_05830 [Flavobacteriales bacterium]|nr:hypothetical protein [Flavobacteriales bacterium]